MPGDYYRLLRIARNASLAQIQEAYRMLALQQQPSSTESPPPADPQLLQIHEAYEILSDPDRRADYDRQLTPDARLSGSRPQWRGVSGPAHLFQSFYTHRPGIEELSELMVRNYTGQHLPKSNKVEDLNLEIVLSRREAEAGGAVPLRIPVPRVCGTCQGAGRAGYFVCDRCEGIGTAWEAARLDVVVPRNTHDGTVIPVSLRPLGIRNMRLNVRLRISDDWH